MTCTIADTAPVHVGHHECPACGALSASGHYRTCKHWGFDPSEICASDHCDHEMLTIHFDDVADNVYSSTVDNSRFVSTFRAYLGVSWSPLDMIESITFVKPDLARIIYLDIVEGNERKSCLFGF